MARRASVTKFGKWGFRVLVRASRTPPFVSAETETAALHEPQVPLLRFRHVDRPAARCISSRGGAADAIVYDFDLILIYWSMEATAIDT